MSEITGYKSIKTGSKTNSWTIKPKLPNVTVYGVQRVPFAEV